MQNKDSLENFDSRDESFNVDSIDLKSLIFILLKWKPKVSIKEGVNKLLLDIKYWKRAPVWTPKKINNATKAWFKYLK